MAQRAASTGREPSLCLLPCRACGQHCPSCVALSRLRGHMSPQSITTVSLACPLLFHVRTLSFSPSPASSFQLCALAAAL